ncbi:glucosaminidase domain-containing protein [Marinobacter sp. 2_MG-2023]|uniref:glucosaminidase domain-containing protein n=1 Tax=Marinobacter sp. 2_MG-2023 TaxID=3062679 RepID=UPI0026E23C6A|nr:glucosaminidase domain-containing protein [Marinobacter sp. 2_MG-2023]MDO6443736.1 glucosaminidase domain-containing protein [Marinobacter sp. 2_MG-2023]
MSAAMRSLMLVVPLVAFAIGGGLYVPSEKSTYDDNSGSEPALSSLPPLPAWAREELPDFSGYQDTTEKKVAFFSFLYPRIVLANSRILIERDYLDSLTTKDTLSKKEYAWLAAQSKRLRVDEEPGSPEQFALLRKRLDIIPPSLILAQAANESAWGTSRFALRGNNLFGQWCFTKGCGLVPLNRIEGASHEVASFSSPYHSVRAYIQNLNRHASYQGLRDTRLDDRKTGDPLSGLALARGLSSYSERGEEYVSEIRSMIRYNNLEFYDLEFRNILSDRSPSHLKSLASAKAGQTLLPGQIAGERTAASAEG